MAVLLAQELQLITSRQHNKAVFIVLCPVECCHLAALLSITVLYCIQPLLSPLQHIMYGQVRPLGEYLIYVALLCFGQHWCRVICGSVG
jgi:hypothetical protein